MISFKHKSQLSVQHVAVQVYKVDIALLCGRSSAVIFKLVVSTTFLP